MNLNEKRKFNIETAVLAFVIILMPFNDVPIKNSIFGELSSEGAFYPLLILIILYFFKMARTGKIHILKNTAFNVMMIYLLWILISGAFNYGDIVSNFTKGRTGTEKYLLQLFVYIFCLIAANIVYLTVKNNNISLYDIRKYILFSFIIAGAYSIFEILKLNNMVFANSIINKLDSFIRSKDITQPIYSEGYGRLRSVSGESSWYSMYAAFIFPWLFSYLFEKKHKILSSIMFFYFLIMIYYTKSRTGYFIITIEFILILIFVFRTKSKKKIANALVILMIFCTIFGVVFQFNDVGNKTIGVFNSIFNSSNSDSYYSNLARFNSQKAAIKMGISSPIFGIGFGQYGFYMPQYIDSTALSLSNELEIWASSDEDTPWAPVHALYPRIIGETGFIGLFIWLYFCIYTLLKINELLKIQRNSITFVLIISFIGVLLAFFNIDSFRFFPFWVLTGIIFTQFNSNNIQ